MEPFTDTVAVWLELIEYAEVVPIPNEVIAIGPDTANNPPILVLPDTVKLDTLEEPETAKEAAENAPVDTNDPVVVEPLTATLDAVVAPETVRVLLRVVAPETVTALDTDRFPFTKTPAKLVVPVTVS